MATIKLDVEVDDRPVKSLKSELRNLVYEMAGLELGTAEFEKVNERASELRDKINEVNEQIAVFATGSKLERVSNSFGEISQGLMDLDFDRATQGAKLLQKTAGAITFKDAATSLKDLGGVIVSVGKTILTNPLFLLAGIVVAIVVAVYKLLDSMGVLKTVMKALGDAIGWVVQQFKNWLDFIGLTNFAQQDLYKQIIENNEKIIASEQTKIDAITSNLDFEIRKRQANGEDTAKLEREKLVEVKNSAFAQAKAYRMIAMVMAELNGRESEEYKEAKEKMENAKKAFIQAGQEIEIYDITAKKKAKDAREKELADNKASEEKKAQQAREYALKAEQEREREAQERLTNQRQISDLELQLIEDDSEKEIAILNEKYKRINEDLESSLLQNKLTREEFDKLTKLQAKMQAKELNDITLKNEEETTAKQQEALKAYEEMMFNLRAESITKTVDAMRMGSAEELTVLQEKFNNGLISEQQFNEGKVALQQKLNEDLATLTASLLPTEEEESPIDKMRREGEEKQALLEELLANSLITQEEYNARRDENEKVTAENIAKYERELQSQKVQGFVQAGTAILGALAKNAKEGSALAKAVGVAQATIDTYKSAVSAYSSLAGIPIVGPVLGGVAAAAAVAMGVMNVKKILSTKIPGGGGGGGGNITASVPSPMNTIQMAQDAIAKQAPELHTTNGISAKTQVAQKRDRVVVLDYTDVKNKEKENNYLKESITLA